MNLNQRTDHKASFGGETSSDLDGLLERCRNDLKTIDDLLSQIEEPADSLRENDTLDLSLIQIDQSLFDDVAIKPPTAPALTGADAVRKLTENIEALSSAPFRSDVQPVLQAMHDNMVRCLKLVPAQRRD
jgi:hypothetical protein